MEFTRGLLDPALIFLPVFNLVAVLLIAWTVPRPFELRAGVSGQVQLICAFALAMLAAWAGTGNLEGTIGISVAVVVTRYSISRLFPQLSVAGSMVMAVPPVALVVSVIWSHLLMTEQDYPFWLHLMGTVTVGLSLLMIGFNFAGRLARQALFTHNKWRRPIRSLPARGVAPTSKRRPKVSVQLPCYSEPPELVIQTLDHLARLDYPSFEVLVCDNNTEDEALWRPLEAHCARLNARLGVERFRFFHVAPISGAKAGALNFLMSKMAPDAELIAVIDADYLSRPDFLSRLVGFFDDPAIGYVQTPHDYRRLEGSAYQRACYWEYMPSNKIDMPGVSEYDAAFTIGTMCLIRTDGLRKAGGWAEWCLTEDSEVSIRLRTLGYDGIYLRETFGRGLIPSTFEDYKKQRFRWTAGPVQQLRRYWRHFLPAAVGKPTALGGWSKLLEVQRSIAPLQILFGVVMAIVTGGAIAVATATGAVQPLDLPPAAWGAMAIGLLATLISTWHRYRLSGCTRLSSMVAGEVAKMSLTYVMMVAGVAGLSNRPLAWRRTPKFDVKGSGIRALLSTGPETALGIGFVGLALGMWSVGPNALGGDLALLTGAGAFMIGIRFLSAPFMALMSERDLKREGAGGVESELPFEEPLKQAA